MRTNTHSIVLSLDDMAIKKFNTIPTFKNLLHPNQLSQLKIGDNQLTVNNTMLGKLERMAGPGGYTFNKQINK